ncbi:helix-turn-helix domain-containing protein [Oceanobacillus sp. Castelsardo]|uniref:helix-turn-helix domain-containing protein n=1 Tax=Oceanobacillus sp. Castelsardo TaxID=1851204 RepID=UPI0008384345|nr:helix-turn-helix domain-containing protein [Oceanobacillus sp. Castelsardo]
MIFERILLDCFQNIQAERSSSSIYHLLKGKRSIQTVQDAHIYSLDPYYGIYKNISKGYYDKKIQELVKGDLLEKVDEKEMTHNISHQGLVWKNNQSYSLFFKGLLYYDKTDVFIGRLLLLVQTLTNSKMNFYSFIPVVNNPQIELWVRNMFRQVKGSESVILQKIYSELKLCLFQLTEKEANIFVDRLTGYQSYGMSLFQLAKEYEMTVDDIHLILISIIHRILNTLEVNSTKFPVLSTMVDNQSSLSQITNSASETYKYFLNGLTVEQISNVRRLKINTIYDHLVEIALYDDQFPIDQYVNVEEQNEILCAVKRAHSHRLKDIKELVKNEISYFQIRLVLAVMNKQKIGGN